jgi:hypothetical protein
LRRAGYRVEDIDGGMKAWARARLPLDPTGWPCPLSRERGAAPRLAHLNEFPDYYTRLEQMEEQARREQRPG